MFRNFKAVEKTAYGRGSFNKLGEILAPHRNSGEGYLIFFVDEYFEGDEEFKARIVKWLDENPKEKHGIHRYSLEQFGLTPDSVTKHFAAYCREFGIVSDDLTPENSSV